VNVQDDGKRLAGSTGSHTCGPPTKALPSNQRLVSSSKMDTAIEATALTSSVEVPESTVRLL
jgi:allophanate hydrolase subunit 2